MDVIFYNKEASFVDIVYWPRHFHCQISEMCQMYFVVKTSQRGYLTFDAFLAFDSGAVSTHIL